MSSYYYPNYATIYQAVVNGVSLWGSPTRRACFGDSLGRFRTGPRNNAEYHIILIRDNSWLDSNYKNQCRMSKHQLENYLRRIATIKQFKYKVEEGDFNGSKCFHLYIKISGTQKEATFVLQCIKRTYEWPYCFFLEQAFHLQELPEFKHDSILNLFNVVFSCFMNYKNTDHCFSGNAKFEKYSTIRARLPHVAYTSDVYPDSGIGTKIAPQIAGIAYHGSYPSTPTQWTNELFQELLPYYVKNYKLLKR